MNTYKVTKLSRLEEPHHNINNETLHPGFEAWGPPFEMPTIGRRFIIIGDYGISTSPVKCVYQHGSESQDKLVLPSDFPKAKELVIPELKNSDYLFATLNSVYHLTKD